ncbi:PQQ-binding-like beta-propeller repeat protein [Asanoa sp. WMMD1127]|uniref:outer membrane protein assembly factor BamB family protein n=1 Tax=Asanoa sp. WMMD1127 TaxID=3016107 RepID=UPI00241650AA|nr:PQQ-binding-like beta-propeller repeat protein [Asanoa sp. WMMD1127]MDG4822470.1 PQQ-binding-like beta-propeller repeat protein [Asanoa sp. WMMD1127]
MARGNGPCVKCWAAFVAVLLVVGYFTGVLTPLLDRVWAMVNTSSPMTNPAPLWQQQLGGTPRSGTIAGGAVIIEHRTLVESRGLGSGAQLWEHKADWAAVAGEGASAVVVTGKLLVKGYEVVDPMSGSVRRRDTEARAVWTYRNGMLDVRCHGPEDCTLSAWDPLGSTPRWSVQIPGIGFVLFADNPDILGTQPLTAKRIDGNAGGPDLMPPMVGLPIDDQVFVVDTAAGQVVREITPERDERIVVVGGRVLRIKAVSADGTCYFSVVASDAATGGEVWRNAGINLRTAKDGGCAQRDDPAGGRNVIVGVAADARELVIDAYDGRFLFTGAPGEHLLGVDDRYAVVRTADGGAVRSVELGGNGRWQRPAAPRSNVALTPPAVVVVDEKPDKIIAVNPGTGAELVNVRSDADVLAVGPAGMIVVSGRDIAYLPFRGAAGGPAPPPAGGNPGTPDDDWPECGGPKQEVCKGG